MDTRRIDEELREAIERSPGFELSNDLLEHHPEVLREQRRQAALAAPRPVPDGLIVEDRRIPGLRNAPEVRLRVYRPVAAQSAPVLVYFHGGGFVFGSPEQVDHQLFRLAIDTGSVIVSVDYRLAPEHPFPAAIEDGYAALLWLRDHASTLGGSPDKIAVSGASAGGGLAAGLSQLARDEGGPEIALQILIYPVTDHAMTSPSMLEFTDAPLWTPAQAAICWKHYLGANPTAVSPYASPLTAADFSLLPRAFVLVCGLDPLRDEGIAYAQRLMQAGVAVELQVLPGAVHLFDVFPGRLTERFHATLVRVLWETFAV